ncbi:unnamed protein product [Spirodela intermedia]|uniref:mitogen-activated protein kinase kinase n=1 Tax=Spirodela intermedia TaxID=51605 RepID=A0A7I8KLN5_SPIIN|nr:unnamed protein product [Spirodela intermedia]
MRPPTPPTKPTASQSQNRRTAPPRRPELTLSMPPRDPAAIAVPLPLPPPHAPPPSSSSSSSSAALPPSSSSQVVTPPLSDLERVRRLGSGSGGTVWLVRHRTTGCHFALKVIHGLHDDHLRRHISREIEILRAADDPSVVRYHHMYVDQAGEIQLLLEYMDGGSLGGRRISSEPSLADISCQVLQGLRYLHRRRIVHRDIKPANLLVNSSRQVKIADFGVSRILPKSLDPCNSSVGTIAYMSPERINTDPNRGVYDGYAADIWSFGLTVLEFYLGRYPFGEEAGRRGDLITLMCAICYSDPPAAPPTASPELRGFISCCLQKDPTRRLTAEQLLRHPFLTRAKAAAAPPQRPPPLFS